MSYEYREELEYGLDAALELNKRRLSETALNEEKNTKGIEENSEGIEKA
ncbi:hypothetical protein [Domibacillus tundrae]